jgi:hypothetical protein
MAVVAKRLIHQKINQNQSVDVLIHLLMDLSDHLPCNMSVLPDHTNFDPENGGSMFLQIIYTMSAQKTAV